MTKKLESNLPRFSEVKRPDPLISKSNKKKLSPFRLTSEEVAIINLKTEEMNRISKGAARITKTGTIRALICMAAKTDPKILLKFYISTFTGI